MPRKEVVHVALAAASPNLSPATRFGNLVFVAGQTGRHPTTGQVGQDIREQTTERPRADQAHPGGRRHVARQRADRHHPLDEARGPGPLQRGVCAVLSGRQARPNHRGGDAELSGAAWWRSPSSPGSPTDPRSLPRAGGFRPDSLPAVRLAPRPSRRRGQAAPRGGWCRGQAGVRLSAGKLRGSPAAPGCHWRPDRLADRHQGQASARGGHAGASRRVRSAACRSREGASGAVSGAATG